MERETKTWNGPHGSWVTATQILEDAPDWFPRRWEVEGTFFSPYRSVSLKLPGHFATADEAIAECSKLLQQAINER